MKVTKKSTKREIETTEVVCEISKQEFDAICAKTAADVVTDIMGDDPDTDDIEVGVFMVTMFAKYVSNLAKKMFNPKANENPDKNPDKNNKEEN